MDANPQQTEAGPPFGAAPGSPPFVVRIAGMLVSSVVSSVAALALFAAISDGWRAAFFAVTNAAFVCIGVDSIIRPKAENKRMGDTPRACSAPSAGYPDPKGGE